MARGDVYEPALTRAYWAGKRKGALVERFRVANRAFDGLIIDGLPHERHDWKERGTGWWRAACGRSVEVLQTKAVELEMPLMGQTLFSCELVKRHLDVRAVRGTAICAADDAEMRRLLETESRIELSAAVIPKTGTYRRPPRDVSLLERYHIERMDRIGRLVPHVRIGIRAIADAVLFLDGEGKPSFDGRDVIVLHTAKPLGMSVMGLAYFSARLLNERHSPASLRSLALCRTAPDDLAAVFDTLRPTVDYEVLP